MVFWDPFNRTFLFLFLPNCIFCSNSPVLLATSGSDTCLPPPTTTNESFHSPFQKQSGLFSPSCIRNQFRARLQSPFFMTSRSGCCAIVVHSVLDDDTNKTNTSSPHCCFWFRFIVPPPCPSYRLSSYRVSVSIANSQFSSSSPLSLLYKEIQLSFPSFGPLA
jgi:hypothetical protein